jgi:ribosome-associated heat shock protein Hsp15
LDSKIEKVRVDKWLWWARFYKTRSLSAKKISSGVVRLNSRRVRKPSAEITIDDVLTLKHGEIIRVIKVISLEEGRKNYDKAKKMYEDIEHIK